MRYCLSTLLCTQSQSDQVFILFGTDSGLLRYGPRARPTCENVLFCRSSRSYTISRGLNDFPRGCPTASKNVSETDTTDYQYVFGDIETDSRRPSSRTDRGNRNEYQHLHSLPWQLLGRVLSSSRTVAKAYIKCMASYRSSSTGVGTASCKP